jgi:hypothetical protein
VNPIPQRKGFELYPCHDAKNVSQRTILLAWISQDDPERSLRLVKKPNDGFETGGKGIVLPNHIAPVHEGFFLARKRRLIIASGQSAVPCPRVTAPTPRQAQRVPMYWENS